MMKKWLLIFAAIMVLGLSPLTHGQKPKVVATTTMIGDLVRELAPDEVHLTVLMGPGVDPHLYKATASDLVAMRSADIIFYNGLMLEGKLSTLLMRNNNTGKKAVAVSKDVPHSKLLGDAEYTGQYDPHIWFDAELWGIAAETTGKELARLVPSEAEAITMRSIKFAERCKTLSQEFHTLSQKVPADKRVLVTSHDAFQYFGNAYGYEVVGVQGLSTVSEAGLADMTKVVELVRARKLPAIFVESSVSPAAIRRISEESGAKIGGELFSDALGKQGDIRKLSDGTEVDVGTWEGMMRYNVVTIVEGLSK